MKPVFSVDQIRRAENKLMALQSDPDELMISAASAVADVAFAMLKGPLPPLVSDDKVLILVGTGGNGGDALYAGAFLAEEGFRVDALLLDNERYHQSALAYFESLGGIVLREEPQAMEYRLLIDGILGIGGRDGLSPDTARFVENFNSSGVPVLAVDIPSGVNADTGAVPEPVLVTVDGFEVGAPIARQKIPTHINADVTITFGGLRRAHAVTAACGEVLIADISVAGAGGYSLAQALTEVQYADGGPQCYASKAWNDPPELIDSLVEELAEASSTIQTIGPHFISLDIEPSPEHDKYSGGIVGIVAGSEQYPGAAVLATAAAVRATSSMVRYTGPASAQVIAALPEVVAAPTLEATGRVQAWVFGPGRGINEHTSQELQQLLHSEEPLLIDADGLTLLSGSAELRQALRTRQGATVLTPHRGEFDRIAQELRAEGVDIPDSEKDPIAAAFALSENLQCCVLLKGRFTVIATSDYAYLVNAGHSWSATPGSGDVLSGLIGAHLAHSIVELKRAAEYLPELEIPKTAMYVQVAPAVTIHAMAAALSAQTEFGSAPTSASRIAAAISPATALANNQGLMNFS
ncbi:bifunctional ADP-dependent NAD(P)H-hydrate dehydratase/NAD(P)H-hydrate epimerase [Corynebacterium callunae]|uniref:bifunctional ADP-dependent NAD(P)H-hydrate dehydratase/NAD(P)H-hydrate epimerase n=1 Tax=Corynebacterium callunae TaxID=1721 RepID=UPI003981DD52